MCVCVWGVKWLRIGTISEILLAVLHFIVFNARDLVVPLIRSMC
jgi:hypothetical protein